MPLADGIAAEIGVYCGHTGPQETDEPGTGFLGSTYDSVIIA